MHNVIKVKAIAKQRATASTIFVLLKVMRLKNAALFHRNIAKIYQKKANQIQYQLLMDTVNIRSIGAIKRFSIFYEKQVPTMDDAEFRENFRVSRNTFNFLVQNLQSLKKNITRFKSPITLDKRIAVALYSLGKK